MTITCKAETCKCRNDLSLGAFRRHTKPRCLGCGEHLSAPPSFYRGQFDAAVLHASGSSSRQSGARVTRLVWDPKPTAAPTVYTPHPTLKGGR